MRSLLREPLIHFLLIGTALFFIFVLFNDPAGPQSDRIVITPGQIEYLKANYTRTWQRSPTSQGNTRRTWIFPAVEKIK